MKNYYSSLSCVTALRLLLRPKKLLSTAPTLNLPALRKAAPGEATVASEFGTRQHQGYRSTGSRSSQWSGTSFLYQCCRRSRLRTHLPRAVPRVTPSPSLPLTARISPLSTFDAKYLTVTVAPVLFDGKSWSGDAASVVFTTTGCCEDINKIVVTMVALPTPASLPASLSPGKIHRS